MTSRKKKTIERSTIKPETLTRKTDKEFEKREYKPVRFPLRIRILAKYHQTIKYARYVITMAKKHPRSTLTIIRLFMKIKGNQTSTKAGVALLVTILGLFGLDANPDLLGQHLTTAIEASLAVAGAVTGLYAIFKDDEKETAEDQEPTV